MRVRDWRNKAVLQRLLSAVPQGHRLNYLLQRTVGGLPVSDDEMSGHIVMATEKVAALRRSGVDPTTARTFEFGAGFDLHMPLIQAALGVHRQVLVDIRPLARPALVGDNLDRLRVWPDPPSGWSLPERPPGAGLHEVLDATGIEYRAPADARATGEPDGSFDAVLTTSTLEHIPEDELVAILRECHRILRPGGVVVSHIDYADHWSYFDPTITPYHFLRYTSTEWQRWNPSLMWQSRLRHSDYLRIFRDAGFDVIAAEPSGGSDRVGEVEALALAEPFAGADPHDVAVLGSFVVARRPG